MNWIKYLSESEVTLSNEFFTSERTQHLLHSIMGVLCEVEELLKTPDGDIANLVEEVGDITWFLAILGRDLGVNMPDVFYKTKEDTLIYIVELSCSLLDDLKKNFFYNRVINFDSFKERVTLLFNAVGTFIVIDNKLSLEDVYDVNISKLRQRYVDKFDIHLANNRNLVNERNILEKGSKNIQLSIW